MNMPTLLCQFLNKLSNSEQIRFIRQHLEQYGPTYHVDSKAGYTMIDFAHVLPSEAELRAAAEKFNPEAYDKALGLRDEIPIDKDSTETAARHSVGIDASVAYADMAAKGLDWPTGLGKSGFAAPGVYESVAAKLKVPVGAVMAPDLLCNAAQHMQDRAEQRDKPGGERSMRRTVDAFNTLLGTTLSERDGWLFMAVLKIARATNTPTGALDDYEDLAAYGALAGESVARGEQA